MIPKIIHITWKNIEGLKTNYINLDNGEKMSLAQCMDTFRDKNPHWQIRFWSDNDMDSLTMLKYPRFYPVYRDLKRIEKVDFFRYLCLYEHGGLFLDTDCICIRPLDELLDLFPDASIITAPEFRHRSNWMNYIPHRQLNIWAVFSTAGNCHMRNILAKVIGNCTMDSKMPVIEKTSMAAFGDYLYAAEKIDTTIKIVSESYISMDARLKYMHYNSYGCLDSLPAYILHGYHGSWIDSDFKKYADEMNYRDSLIKENLNKHY